MKRKAVWVSCFFLALALLLGCQTAKPMAPEESAIQAEKSGFSPKGSVEQATMELSLLWGNGESITSWKVEIAAGGAVARTWSGA
jgi:hypothetical protein